MVHQLPFYLVLLVGILLLALGFLLGGIVSPPDVVSATSILRNCPQAPTWRRRN
jgi:NhaP-type Na+/H+ or K+/H+ antiporter